MHDDDWFADKTSLEHFVKASNTSGCFFIFSGFKNIVIETGHTEKYIINPWDEYLLKRNPFNILKKNFIGHPSTTFIKNNVQEWYDERLKWVVDIEFYTRILLKNEFFVIREPLVNLGISNQQVTQAVFRKPEVEIPEHLYMLNKISPLALRAICAYDYFWRFIRNLSIRSVDKLKLYFPADGIPSVIKLMINYQKTIPEHLLRLGLISKLMMIISYFHCRVSGVLKKLLNYYESVELLCSSQCFCR
jgi:hypothetical protein